MESPVIYAIKTAREYNENAELVSSIEKFSNGTEIKANYSPPIPICKIGESIHTTSFDKPVSGIDEIKFIFKSSIINGFLHRKTYLYRETEVGKKGSQVTHSFHGYDSDLGLINHYDNNFIFESIYMLDK